MTIDSEPRGLDPETIARFVREFDGRYGEPRAVSGEMFFDSETGEYRDAIITITDKEIEVIKDFEMTNDLPKGDDSLLPKG